MNLIQATHSPEQRDFPVLCAWLWAEEAGVQEQWSLECGRGCADGGLCAHLLLAEAWPLAGAPCAPPPTHQLPACSPGQVLGFASRVRLVDSPAKTSSGPLWRPPKDGSSVAFASLLGVFLSLGSVLGKGGPESWGVVAPGPMSDGSLWIHPSC